MIKKLLGVFLFWRIFLFLPLLVAHLVIPERKGYEYALLPYFIKAASPLNHFLLFPFANFDAIYYLLIAATGYTVNAGFFPLFPFLVRALNLPFGFENPFTVSEYTLTTILVTACTLGALYAFYKLVLLDHKKVIAFYSVAGLLFFPTAFFFATLYSESLFLLLSLLSFYFVRKGKWLFAGIAGMMLSATRIVGIAILPALLWEFYVWIRQAKKKTLKEILARLLPILLTPLGLITYMAYNAYKWGDPLFFVTAQGSFSNNRTVDGIVLLPQTVYRYGKILMSVSSLQYEWWIALLELVAVLFALLMIFIAWRQKIRLSYLLFSLCALLIPGSTGTFTGMPRYVLVLFPIFIALALVKSSTVRFVAYIFFFLLQILLFTLFAKGYFVA